MKTFMIYWYIHNPYGDMCGSFFRLANDKQEADKIATEDLSGIWTNRNKLILTITDVTEHCDMIEAYKSYSEDTKELMYAILETLLEKSGCN